MCSPQPPPPSLWVPDSSGRKSFNWIVLARCDPHLLGASSALFVPSMRNAFSPVAPLQFPALLYSYSVFFSFLFSFSSPAWVILQSFVTLKWLLIPGWTEWPLWMHSQGSDWARQAAEPNTAELEENMTEKNTNIKNSGLYLFKQSLQKVLLAHNCMIAKGRKSKYCPICFWHSFSLLQPH